MKTFYQAIYEWVADNFGAQEVEDPSWNIEALAEHLNSTDILPDELNASTKLATYDKIKAAYLDEDIENLANNRGVKLTPGEVEQVKHCYYKMDDETYAQLGEIVDEIIYERKKNETA